MKLTLIEIEGHCYCKFTTFQSLQVSQSLSGQDGKSAKNHPDKKREGETIQIITKDLIRTLR